MPTYYANGITAKLRTCDLQSTLSDTIELRQGAAQREDAARVQNIFAQGRKLPERPIGPDGSDKGVLNFIGPNSDLPLYMVEAGQSVGEKNEDAMEGIEQQRLPISSDDSPLTSLGATPTPTKTRSKKSSPLKPTAPAVQPPACDPPPTEHSLSALLQDVNNYLTTPRKALVVEVNLSQKSFLATNVQKSSRKRSSAKDLKIEVFVNGELCDVEYVAARKAFEISAETMRYSGLRLHRQVEKPLVYAPAGSRNVQGHASTVRRQWAAVCDALVDEADIRGRDQSGALPPSAEFLMALATLEVLERMKGCEALGVIDVIITAGKGKKYGPDTAYITAPARLDDAGYQRQRMPALDLSEKSLRFAGSIFDITNPFEDLATFNSSPETLLRRSQTQATSAPPVSHVLPIGSPTPKKSAGNLELASEMGIELDPKKILFESFEKTSGRAGRGARTLNQRLGDVKKMSPANRDKEIDKLKEQYGTTPTKVKADEEPVTKKKKPNTNFGLADADVDIDMPMEDNDEDALIAEDETTMNPAEMLKHWQPRSGGAVKLSENMADVDAQLTEQRLDLAISEGGSPDGHLVRRIASMSPQRTPTKKTKASALANSPTAVQVKSQRRSGRPPKTPQAQRTSTVFAGDNGSPSKPQTPNTQRSCGLNRTAHKWEPKELTSAQALQQFKAPEVCQGSCVTYAEEKDAQRQVVKARNGEFREEEVVVGMRFVVVWWAMSDCSSIRRG
ncbi:hypothetical protein LTR37_013449 [Vermiconidia calcicola]|uniref:Uncharacterized protein n=1 Tax=Vermiconidia calcicola TaxID=1690605 RepID=A0ACC3MY10_9PEZI|nr:hypothetical protein LTR37_013449 [Vermiconidia calcicola]